MKSSRAVILTITLAFLVLWACPTSALSETIERVSVDTDGQDADDQSDYSSISADGRYVAFESWATDLVPLDTNDMCDIFVRDRKLDSTERVSVSSSGQEAEGYGSGGDGSWNPSISPDGRYVAYSSNAYNLVDSDLNDLTDVFVRDLWNDGTYRVSVSSDEEEANGGSGDPHITTDDEIVYVAYTSRATNLVAVDGNNEVDAFLSFFYKISPTDIYTRMMSVSSAGSQTEEYGSIYVSVGVDDANVYVAYETRASNLVSGDDNDDSDVFVSSLSKEDLEGASVVTKRASLKSGGVQYGLGGMHPSISADGRYVAYETLNAEVSSEANRTDISVTDWNHDNPADIVTEVASVAVDGGEPDAGASMPSINGDGRYVAFYSRASNLVPYDPNDTFDIFVRDREQDITYLVSTASDGSPANDRSEYPAITPSFGDFVPMVSFYSNATNLVAGATDANEDRDVFVAALPVASAAPVKKTGGMNRYEQTDEHIVYTGEWTTQEDESHSGGSINLGKDHEATITITFRGTRLDWIATMGPLMGKVWLSLDGGEPVLVDFFSATELFQQVVWSTGTLKYGVHVIKIYFPEDLEPTELRPISIDALDVYGELF